MWFSPTDIPFERTDGVLNPLVTSGAATYTVSGTLTEDDGTTAISGATVTADVGATQLDQVTTDANGNFALSAERSDSDLPETWDITADASGFTAQTKQVSVSTGSTSYTVDFSLSPEGLPAARHAMLLGM